MKQMAYIEPCNEMFGDYSAALLAWLAAGQGGDRASKLQRARELGATALGNDVSPSQLLALHHQSVKQILGLMRTSDECRNCQNPAPCHDIHLFLQSLTPQDTIAAAGVFFAESMAPFDDRERDLRRSNAALRYENTRLEREVQRFTRVVYDEGMQLLAAARIAMAEAADASAPAVCRPLDQVQKLLGEVEDQLTACTDTERPHILDVLGPRSAVQSFCHRFARRTGIDVKAELGNFPVSPEIGVPIYKAVREALLNVEQHAQASRVRVWLYEEPSAIHCFVQDDGMGFDVPSVLSALEFKGSGLASATEALQSAGGTVVINSVQGTGTSLKISIKRRRVPAPADIPPAELRVV
jgi:signal transduction histidine kinase